MKPALTEKDLELLKREKLQKFYQTFQSTDVVANTRLLRWVVNTSSHECNDDDCFELAQFFIKAGVQFDQHQVSCENPLLIDAIEHHRPQIVGTICHQLGAKLTTTGSVCLPKISHVYYYNEGTYPIHGGASSHDHFQESAIGAAYRFAKRVEEAYPALIEEHQKSWAAYAELISVAKQQMLNAVQSELATRQTLLTGEEVEQLKSKLWRKTLGFIGVSSIAKTLQDGQA